MGSRGFGLLSGIWRDTAALGRLYAFEYTPIGNSIHVCLQRMIVACNGCRCSGIG